MPFGGGERRRRTSSSSSKRSFARALAPPSAFHPSTSPNMYIRANGVSFARSTSATSGKEPLQKRFTKPAPGVQRVASRDEHFVGMVIATGAGGVAAG